MNPLIFVKRCILILLLTPIIRLTAPYCNWLGCYCDAQKNATTTTCKNTTNTNSSIGCYCEAQKNSTTTTCKNTTNTNYVPIKSTNTAAIIGAASGGIVFGSVVTVLVFVCIWRAVCKETRAITTSNFKEARNRMIANPVYDPGDGTIEENTNEQNGENVGYSEIKDVTISKGKKPAIQQEQSSLKKDVDNQLIGFDKENKSGKYDRLELVVSNKMEGYEPMNAHSDNSDDQKDNSAGESEKSTIGENEKSDDYYIVEKNAINE